MPSSPVYSQPFILYTPDTPNESFLVPDGFTAVIRDIAAAQGVGGWGLGVFITGPGSGAGVQICAQACVGTYNSVNVSGRWVALEGYTISIGFTSIGSSPSAYVGGYLLRNNLT